MTDLQIAARALSFMEAAPSGDVRVGIVYAASNRATLGQARSVAAMLGGGLRVGNLNLEPVLVDIGNATNADVDLFFLTESLGDEAAKIAGASRARATPCITTDIAQVRGGACALGIRSRPKVQILVNRASADSAGTRFATAFRMMVTEL